MACADPPIVQPCASVTDALRLTAQIWAKNAYAFDNVLMALKDQKSLLLKDLAASIEVIS